MHTKEEWTVTNAENVAIVEKGIIDHIATVCHCKDKKANAQLIAAAPDLLEACKNAKAWLSEQPGMTSRIITKNLQQAINKATE